MHRALGILAIAVIFLSLLAAVFFYKNVVKPSPPLESELPLSVEDKSATKQNTITSSDIKATYSGNGHDRLLVKLTNSASGKGVFEIKSAQAFSAGSNVVLTLAPTTIEVAPRSQWEVVLKTAPLRSKNELIEQIYQISTDPTKRLEPLLKAISQDPDLPYPVIQTAVLIAAENPPLEVFSQFITENSDLPATDEEETLKVTTHDLLRALKLVLNTTDDPASVLILNDERLKAESLVNPQTSELAEEIYGFTPEDSWDYWNDMLTKGDPRYRHYALYGIGRNFPGTALKMMPKWIEKKNLPVHYRTAAVHALAQTELPQALEILETINSKPQSNSEVKEALRRAIYFLRSKLNMQ